MKSGREGSGRGWREGSAGSGGESVCLNVCLVTDASMRRIKHSIKAKKDCPSIYTHVSLLSVLLPGGIAISYLLLTLLARWVPVLSPKKAANTATRQNLYFLCV